MRTITAEQFEGYEAAAWGASVDDRGRVTWPGDVDVRESAPRKGSAKIMVNRGNWIAECPDGCGYASMMHDANGTLSCPNHRARYSVDWPQDWLEIEAALGKRKEVNRNMDPGQTLADLLEENLSNGVD